jgi:hypothetical protein
MDSQIPPGPRTQDDEHLWLLTLFHYVVGGMAALIALFPIFHLGLGIFFIVAGNKLPGNGQAPPAFVGWLFVIFAAIFILIGWTFAALVILNGRFLARRKNYTFCLVMGAVESLFMPFGTILSVFTLIVLLRPSVKEMFTASRAISP